MNQKKIGKRISERRKIKNLTQQELANELNVTNRTIINWESGKCLPDYSLLLPLCKELDISINELLTGEEDKEQKTNATIELILDYLDRDKFENLKGYSKVGKIFLIGGIFLTIIGVQIPIEDYIPEIFLDSLICLYPIIGLIFSFIGFKFINKKYHFKKRFILNSVYLICGILFLMIADIISIKIYNRIPRYFTNDIVNFEGGIEEILYYETPFYDVYTCSGLNFKIIPLSIKHYDDNDAVYLRNKYCNNIEANDGGENK